MHFESTLVDHQQKHNCQNNRGPCGAVFLKRFNNQTYCFRLIPVLCGPTSKVLEPRTLWVCGVSVPLNCLQSSNLGQSPNGWTLWYVVL